MTTLDPRFPHPNGCVVADSAGRPYSALLNMTDISANNNKFFILQVVQSEGRFFCFRRWGRVGAAGECTMEESASLDQAIAVFERWYRNKTQSDWNTPYVPRPNTYTPITPFAPPAPATTAPFGSAPPSFSATPADSK
eukprot:gnl/Spiro4/23471_TR11603_c0_g3_i1.p1 gnl/Spiro4/23471_TR11603_c0_g3~~gnl/Spiro4/23471_TR11603_c0_g3_i1.p1  ORF type:complete len:138 (+),score=19.17 gnl/Spiro4/23471_TR11603_c0_g3_i1:51-464(+)